MADRMAAPGAVDQEIASLGQSFLHGEATAAN
jgi:hypothetical protein